MVVGLLDRSPVREGSGRPQHSIPGGVLVKSSERKGERKKGHAQSHPRPYGSSWRHCRQQLRKTLLSPPSSLANRPPWIMKETKQRAHPLPSAPTGWIHAGFQLQRPRPRENAERTRGGIKSRTANSQYEVIVDQTRELHVTRRRMMATSG